MTQQESLDEIDPTSFGPDLIIITGMSGAGRTEAMHTFEDIGYFCIDNLPPSLLMNLVSLAGLNTGTLRKLAVVCDLRAKEFFPELTAELAKLKEMGLSYTMLFLDSSDEELLNRFKASRRRHPLCDNGMTIVAGIRRERQLLAECKQMADYVLDTSTERPQDMREKLRSLFTDQSAQEGLGVSVYSFGFKHGAPTDADIVIDVRFLPNPFYERELRDKTGMDEEVKDYVLGKDETKEFLKRWFSLLDFVMPGYVKEGKQYLSIAVGCTGGQHRSVVLANATGQHLSQEGYRVTTTHRDLALAEVHK
ncbi:MAG: RNase adapter RapZ [Coriobacteriales bacterium]|nr:RNase adapter RapZ [Coriobacteriaceae bacterium]MDD7202755.1 RNase adapter RapZ [Coriobacteriaceae bacterium]MDY2722588.1 RNase adapter RapZ [Coriobacteriales bacterium]MDY5661772.1 RNase adapter RapZ [Coriobacteriales bacterium]